MFPEGSETGRGLPEPVDFSTRESGPLRLRFRRPLSCQDSAESLRRSGGAVERQARARKKARGIRGQLA